MDRPWEYELLNAISADSPHLVTMVAKRYSELDWSVRVHQSYGRNQAGEVHYLIASFGLQWELGHTLLDIARLNGKHRAAEAMEGAQPAQPRAEPEKDDGVVVALVQCSSDIGEVEQNLQKLEARVRDAAADGAKIVVLPETSVTGYLSQDVNWGLTERRQAFSRSLDPRKFAEDRNGESVSRMAALARELTVYITVPYLEKAGDNPGDQQFFNSIALVGPESKPEQPALAHYRKNCPWPHPEKSWATPGDGVDESIYDTEYGRVGLAICFDIHTILAKYADKQLWALLYPIAWVGNTTEWFADELPGRLGFVNCPHYILGANWATDRPQGWEGAGGSTVYGPGGQILAHAREKEFHGCEEIVVVRIPTQRCMPGVGELDKEKYQQWSEEQFGTDYWHSPACGCE
eukprot:TRINITY_DN7715_c0_g1_i3.p1 TRINITY_DN7715_c0_g1~~TRINITY_DN7715_c0_g1_i3.p1  ORF type:complete len:405 (+),score=82.18 TRINITY_DN7715_c0_g1_i3:229-1443(+)